MSGVSDSKRIRGALALTLDRRVGPVFAGRLLSSVGIWMQGIVTAVVTYEVTGSATAVGVVAGTAALPQLLLGPLAGRMADSGLAVPLIMLGRFFCLVGCAMLAWAFWDFADGSGRFGLVGIVAASAVIGLGFAVEAPATQAVLPRLVPPAELAPATVLNLMPLTLARAIGPLVGVSVATAMSPGWSFALSAGTQAVLIVVIWTTPIPGGTLIEDGGSRSVAVAVRHVLADGPSWRLLIGIFAVSAGAEPAMTLAPPLAQHLGGGADLAGWLASSFGIGAAVALIFAGPVLCRVTLPCQICGGLVVMAAGLATMAQSPPTTLTVVALVGTGLGMAVAMSSVSTALVDRSPEAIRGRVMALWLVGFLCARPVAGAGGGWLADQVSIAAAFAASSTLVAAGAWVCRPSRLTA